MKKSRLFFFLALVITYQLINVSTLLALDWGFANEDGGQPGAFLSYGAGARSLGMGKTFVGVADDASATYWNPAGLAQLKQNELTALHASLYERTGYSFVSYGQPLKTVTSHTSLPADVGGQAQVTSKDQTEEIDKTSLLEKLKKQYADCKNCNLAKTRTKLVFGVGNPGASLMFIGEGPGYDEDQQGEPFVGRAGQLLSKAIEAIGLTRQQVYITNIVKCHPMLDPKHPDKRGNDRPPQEEEIMACLPILKKQIEIIKPAFICTLGTFAAQTLLNTNKKIFQLRGEIYEIILSAKTTSTKIKVIPTLHPASCLYHQSNKKYVWEDFKKIRVELKKLSK